MAATKPKIPVLHRDISGGNMLILPQLVKDEDGQRRVAWVGILCDWEMAKPIAEVRSIMGSELPRQPERTVRRFIIRHLDILMC